MLADAKHYRAELVNLARSLISPRIFIQTARLFLALVLWRLSRRFIPVPWLYPSSVRQVFRSISTPLRAPTLPGEISAPDIPQDTSLKLASGTFNLVLEGKPNWRQHFDDVEMLVSLHRWGWLTHMLTDEEQVGPAVAENGIALMRSWLAEFGPLPEGVISESYTVSERLANASLFFRVVEGRWDSAPTDIRPALAQARNWLVGNLEYSPFQTGNHVVNNARAIYLFGVATGDAGARDLCFEIFRRELPTLLLPDGFLREGSSHYHLLFCRWLLEVWLAAEESGDHNMMDLIDPFLRSALPVCSFFEIETADGPDFITFGDVSPDCAPDWLAGLPASALARRFLNSASPRHVKSKGWSRLFSSLSQHEGAAPIEQPMADTEKVDSDTPVFRNFEASGFARFDGWGWTAIFHNELPGTSGIASHSHQDALSFVLYSEGREVLLDPGRLSYEADEISHFAAGAAGHNSLMVDGFPALLSNRDFFLPSAYRQARLSVSWVDDGNDGFRISIAHNGYSRIKGARVGQHVRCVAFSADRCIVTDSLSGKGMNTIEWDWHFDAAFTAGKQVRGGILARHEDAGLVASIEPVAPGAAFRTLTESDNPVGGWCFPSYGTKAPALSVRQSVNCSYPVNARVTITRGASA